MSKSKKDIIYAVPVDNCEKKEGETVPYRCAYIDPSDPTNSIVYEGVDTIKKQFIYTVENHGTEPFIGSREVTGYDDDSKPIFGDYIFQTYDEVYTKVIALAKTFVHQHFYNETKSGKKTHRLLGIYAKNCEEWILTDYACMMAGLGNVTLYDTLGADSSEFIMKQTELTTVVCTVDHIKDLVSIKNGGNVRDFINIVSMNPIENSHVEECKDAGLSLCYLYDLIAQGEDVKVQLDDPHCDDVFTICYTSGTTGTPKGVMLTHKNMIAEMAAVAKSDAGINGNDVHISYLPLAHIFERLVF